jgi:small subunit ribosomal protein S3
MGQKVRPMAFRVGIMEPWLSRWYAPKKEYGSLLVEDEKIRRHVKGNYSQAGISKIEIERTRDEVKVTLHVARPGIIIGRQGKEVERLQDELQRLTQRKINIKIEEVAKPQLDAVLAAEEIKAQLLRRANFRRVMKRIADQAMEAGARGVRIELSGRLAGAEMARREKLIQGSVPLQTLRAKISYAHTVAVTPQGTIGIKVWINQGDYLLDRETSHAHAEKG